MEGDPTSTLRRAAMNAITSIPGHEAETFKTLAGFIVNGDERDAAVRAIRRIPRSLWPHEEIRPLLSAMMNHVSSLSAEARTEPAGLDSLQLGKDPGSLLPAKESKDVLSKLPPLGENSGLARTLP